MSPAREPKKQRRNSPKRIHASQQSGRKGSRKRPAPPALTSAQVPAVVKRMAAPSGTDRFDAGKALCATAAKDPARVYPHFDTFAALLDSDSKIVCWNALQIIALLAAADVGRKLDAVLDKYLSFIRGNNLVSAANAIGGATRIGCCRPDLVERLIPAILEVEHATYKTPECRNVAIGQALDTFQELGPSVCRRPDVVAFILRQRANTRAAVAKSAERMAADLALGV